MYNFGEKPCKIEFDDFLSITTDIRMYKSDFKDFSELYEYIEKNLNKITHILFNNYEYFLEKGLLHNLYGPAIIRHNNENAYFKGTSNYFYINGKLVHDDIKTTERGCKKLDNFQNMQIFFYKEITGKKNEIDVLTGKRYRRIEGIDYEIQYINLNEKIKLDQRKKKLLHLNDKK
jgi:hypothetical protein